MTLSKYVAMFFMLAVSLAIGVWAPAFLVVGSIFAISGWASAVYRETRMEKARR